MGSFYMEKGGVKELLAKEKTDQDIFGGGGGKDKDSYHIDCFVFLLREERVQVTDYL